MVASPLRIGVIGLDNSHVVQFLRLFNEPQAEEHVPGGRIVAAYRGGSDEIAASRTRIDNFVRVAVEQYQVALLDRIEDLLGVVDAVMILSVDGRQHLAQFRQAAAARKPVFIDKPMAASLCDALAIAQLARETGTPCFSSSSFRYLPDSPAPPFAAVGTVTAAFSYGPAEREPHHPDLFWYGIHAVEALYAVLGPGCQQVVRTVGAHADVVTGLWKNSCVGILLGNRQPMFSHGVTIVGTAGVMSGGTRHSYRLLALEMMRFFQSGKSPLPLETTIEIHAFMEAADESKRHGGRPVKLDESRQ